MTELKVNILDILSTLIAANNTHFPEIVSFINANPEKNKVGFSMNYKTGDISITMEKGN